MANTVDKVIDIALKEVGYLEKSASAYKKNPSILDKKTAGAGKDNYTKYGRDMHKIYPSVMDFPAYWCDCFVDWCFYKAYGVTTAKSLLGGNFNDYTVASATMYQNKKALDTTPKKGAQVFFTRNGKVSGCHHTGLVYAVDSTYFYTVEGNTSGGSSVVSNGGGVAKKKYRISSYKGKVLFGHPKYDKASSTTKKTDTKTKDTTDDKESFSDIIKELQTALNSEYKKKLTVNGKADDKTLAATPQLNNKIYDNKPKTVTALQKLLRNAGYKDCRAIGIFGEKTTSAVKKFQKEVVKMDKPTGNLNAKGSTWKKLLKLK